MQIVRLNCQLSFNYPPVVFWIFLYIDSESKIVYLPFEYNYHILTRVWGMIILKQLNRKAIWLLDTLEVYQSRFH